VEVAQGSWRFFLFLFSFFLEEARKKFLVGEDATSSHKSPGTLEANRTTIPWIFSLFNQNKQNIKKCHNIPVNFGNFVMVILF